MYASMAFLLATISLRYTAWNFAFDGHFAREKSRAGFFFNAAACFAPAGFFGDETAFLKSRLSFLLSYTNPNMSKNN